MSYTPINLLLYTNVYSAAIAAMTGSGKNPSDTLASDYAGYAAVAGAFAQQMDIDWNSANINTLQLQTVEKLTYAVNEWRTPLGGAPANVPTTWHGVALAIVAITSAASTYFAGQAIVPPVPAPPVVGGNVAGQVLTVNGAATAPFYDFPYGPWASGGSGTNGMYTHADTPVTPTANQRCIPFDTSGGIINISTPLNEDGVSLPADDQVFYVKPMVPSATPATIVANGAGVTVENPSNACNFGASGTVPGQGGVVGWKYQATSKKWIGFTGF